MCTPTNNVISINSIETARPSDATLDLSIGNVLDLSIGVDIDD